VSASINAHEAQRYARIAGFLPVVSLEELLIPFIVIDLGGNQTAPSPDELLTAHRFAT